MLARLAHGKPLFPKSPIASSERIVGRCLWQPSVLSHSLVDLVLQDAPHGKKFQVPVRHGTVRNMSPAYGPCQFLPKVHTILDLSEIEQTYIMHSSILWLKIVHGSSLLILYILYI